MYDLTSKIGIDVQPVYTSKKLEQDFKLKEIKPRIVNQYNCVVYCFKCDLCDSNYVGYTTHHLFFNPLMIIDILSLVAIWEMPMGMLTYSMRATLECLKNVAWNGIVSFMKWSI